MDVVCPVYIENHITDSSVYVNLIHVVAITTNDRKRPWADPEGGQGSRLPPPHEKSQKYRVSQ